AGPAPPGPGRSTRRARRPSPSAGSSGRGSRRSGRRTPRSGGSGRRGCAPPLGGTRGRAGRRRGARGRPATRGRRPARPVGPRHVPVHEGVPAIVLTQLAGDDGEPLRHPSDRAVPARPRDALREVVQVEARDELAGGIVRAMGQPPAELVRPASPPTITGCL